MNKPDERTQILEDVVDVLSRFVDDETREDVYRELVYAFNLQADDATLMIEDPVFDKVFKELIYDNSNDTEEEPA